LKRICALNPPLRTWKMGVWWIFNLLRVR
jgi:hypothetical protein